MKWNIVYNSLNNEIEKKEKEWLKSFYGKFRKFRKEGKRRDANYNCEKQERLRFNRDKSWLMMQIWCR